MKTDSKKRIVIAAEIFPPDIGGPATYLNYILPLLQKMDYEVIVVTFFNTEITEFSNVEIKKISINQPLLIRFAKYFFALLKVSLKADFLWSMGTILSGFPVRIVSLFLQKQYLIRIPGDLVWERAMKDARQLQTIEDFYKTKQSFFLEVGKKLQSWVVRGAKYIYCTSNYQKSMVLLWNVAPEKIVVIYTPYALINQKNYVRQLKSNKNILAIGRLVAYKGFRQLCKNIAPWLRRNCDWKLYIIGDGPDKEHINNTISSLKMSEQIFLLGAISHKEVLDMYNIAHVVILYSLYEGLSHVLLEAMQYNLPIIASRLAGNIELVGEYNRGELVEWDDAHALFNALENIELLENQQGNTEDLLKKYSFDNMASSLKVLLSKME